MSPCPTCDATGRGRDAYGGLDWYRTCPDCSGRGRIPWWQRLGPVMVASGSASVAVVAGLVWSSL